MVEGSNTSYMDFRLVFLGVASLLVQIDNEAMVNYVCEHFTTMDLAGEQWD